MKAMQGQNIIVLTFFVSLPTCLYDILKSTVQRDSVHVSGTELDLDTGTEAK